MCHCKNESDLTPQNTEVQEKLHDPKFDEKISISKFFQQFSLVLIPFPDHDQAKKNNVPV